MPDLRGDRMGARAQLRIYSIVQALQSFPISTDIKPIDKVFGRGNHARPGECYLSAIVRRRIGILDFHFHDLRHTAGVGSECRAQISIRAQTLRPQGSANGRSLPAP